MVPMVAEEPCHPHERPDRRGRTLATPHSVTSKVSVWRLSGLSAAIRKARANLLSSTNSSGPMMNMRKALLLLFVPFVFAARSIGFSWALSYGGVQRSPLAPLVTSQLLLTICLILALRFQHGVNEVRQLYSRRYGYLFVTGTLAGASFCLQNIALTRITPTLLTVLMSAQALPGSGFQIVILRLHPSYTQWASLFAGVLLATQHMSYAKDKVDALDMVGILCGLGGATSLALAGLVFQCFVGKFAQSAADRAAEVKRLIVANEMWKVPISLGIMLAGDLKSISNSGVFYGWDCRMLSGAVFLAAFMTAYRLFAISSCGALATAVAASAEVAIVFLAEVYLLGTGELVASETLGLGALLLAVLMFNLSQLDLQQEKASTLLSASHELDMLHAITNRLSAQARRHQEAPLRKNSNKRPLRCGARCNTV